jgi:hypothetical protein
VSHEAATYDNNFVKPKSGGLLLLRRVTPLPRRDAVYFCSGAYRAAMASGELEPTEHERRKYVYCFHL